MQVSQLIELLQMRLAKHGDRRVMITWEGIFRDVGPSNVYLDGDGDLLIDAGGNYYKNDFAADPSEGEDGR